MATDPMLEGNPTQILQRGYALGKQEAKSLAGAVAALAQLVNEHTFMFHALCKKLNTSPPELMVLLDEKDFVNDTDLPKDNSDGLVRN